MALAIFGAKGKGVEARSFVGRNAPPQDDNRGWVPRID
jgi:hypothetical protein